MTKNEKETGVYLEGERALGEQLLCQPWMAVTGNIKTTILNEK
jgi:hypothetical protein